MRAAHPRGELDAASRHADQALLDGAETFLLERPGGRDFRSHDVLVFEQAIAIGRQKVGQQHEPIALGEKHQQFGEHRRDVGASHELDHGGALAGGGDSRVQQHLFQGRMLPEELDESGKMIVEDLKIDLLGDGHVEERSGVAVGGGFVGHRASLYLIFTSA